MRVQVVYITPGPAGAAARRVETLEVERLSIGRGTDNDVALSGLTVSLHHAQIAMRGESPWVEVVKGPSVLVSGRPRQTQRLQPGDVLRIGHTDLRVLPPEGDAGAGPGLDLLLEVEETLHEGDDRAQLDRRTTLGIERGLLSRRKLSWAAVVVVLAAFLALPLVSREQQSWSSGPISNEHRFFEDQCERCHGAFRAVSDDGCLDCHFSTAPHTADDAAVRGLSATRCADCHIEHTGSQMLADLGEPLCSGCHASIREAFAEATVDDASDFGSRHPPFRLHVVTEPGSGKRTRAVWTPELSERSGLEFNHLRHVGQLLLKPDGERGSLPCGACHTLGEAGTTMRPIDFESACQGCHRLTFDDRVPDREAFHGDPAEMRRQLRALYSDLVVRGEIRDSRAPNAVRFRRPGAQITVRERLEIQEYVDRRVADASRHLLLSPGECARCHEVLPRAASDGGDGIAPVEVARVWMEKSEFRHATHAPFACRDCHPAATVYDPQDDPGGIPPRPAWSLKDAKPYGLLTPEELASATGLEPSVRSSDVLIPSLERCRSCHGGQTADTPQVASGCGLCHPFHRREHAPAAPGIAE